MKLMRQAVLSLSILLVSASMALAQGTTAGNPPAGGGGTTTGNPPAGGGTTTTGQPDKTVDLPVGKPDFKGQPPKPPADPPTNGDDKPPTIYGQEIKSENNTIFYVLDVSGSMGWDVGQYTAPDGSTKSGDRLDRAKAELVKSVTSLPDNFKFGMLSYDCSIYPYDGGAMEPADASHKASAVGWIMSQQPLGGTGTGPATVQGLKAPNNKLVVLLTDGQPNCGAGNDYGNDQDLCNAHRSMIKAGNTSGCVINVYGIGATGMFKQFCMNVASDNGGSYTDVR
jgi:hypothetical protein